MVQPYKGGSSKFMQELLKGKPILKIFKSKKSFIIYT